MCLNGEGFDDGDVVTPDEVSVSSNEEDVLPSFSIFIVVFAHAHIAGASRVVVVIVYTCTVRVKQHNNNLYVSHSHK